MKSFLGLALALSICSSESLAEPLLRLATTIAREEADGTKSTLAAPQIVVESGKQAVVQIENLALALTPKLIANGQVEVQMELSEVREGQSTVLAAPRIVTLLGRTAALQLGTSIFQVEPSLAK